VQEVLGADAGLVAASPRKNARKQIDGNIEQEYKRNIDCKAPKQRDHGSILHIENLAVILAKVN
jgi:hypothetical protein